MKKKILFVVDVPGWAYDDAAKNWKMLLKDDYDIDIFYLSKYDPLRITHDLHKKIKDIQSAAIKESKVDASDLLDIAKMFENKDKSKPKPLFNHKKYDGIFFFYHRALCDSRLLGTPIPLDKVAVSINNEKWVNSGAQEEFESYMKGVKIVVA